MDPAQRLGQGDSCPDAALLFTRLPAEVMTATKLTPFDRLVYAYIVFRTGWPFAEAPIWYSRDRIAKELGFGSATVSRSIGRLKEIGLIRRWTENDRTYTIPNHLTPALIDRIGSALTSRGKVIESREGVAQLQPGAVSERYSTRISETRGVYQADTQYRHSNKTQEKDTPPLPEVVEEGSRRKKEKMDRKTILDSAKEASRKKEVSEAKKRLKNQVRKETRRVETWRGKRFCSFVQTMCGVHDVPMEPGINPGVPHVPPRFVKMMNDALDRFLGRDMTKQDVADMLVKIIETWESGGKDFFYDGRFHFHVLRSDWREIASFFHDKNDESDLETTLNTPAFESAKEALAAMEERKKNDNEPEQGAGDPGERAEGSEGVDRSGGDSEGREPPKFGERQTAD